MQDMVSQGKHPERWDLGGYNTQITRMKTLISKGRPPIREISILTRVATDVDNRKITYENHLHQATFEGDRVQPDSKATSTTKDILKQ